MSIHTSFKTAQEKTTLTWKRYVTQIKDILTGRKNITDLNNNKITILGLNPKKISLLIQFFAEQTEHNPNDMTEEEIYRKVRQHRKNIM